MFAQFDPIDPSLLLPQIASMNPSATHEAAVEPAPQNKIPDSEINGFCDTQDCGKLKWPIEKESNEADDEHWHDGHGHHHHENEGHNDHQHGNSGHDHHHCGSDGHSHIPRFRHHYKPP